MKMKFNIDNLNIFDEDCVNKVEELIKDKINEIDRDKVYHFTISFCKTTSYLSILQEYDAFNNLDSKKDKIIGDKIDKELNIILKKIDQILEEYNIKVNLITIAGMSMNENTVSLKFKETIPHESMYDGRGKNKKLSKCYCIAVDIDYVGIRVAKEVGKDISNFLNTLLGQCGEDFVKKYLQLPPEATIDEMFQAIKREYIDNIFFASSKEKEEYMRRIEARLLE